MLKLVRKSRFKKDFKKLQSAGKDLVKLAEIISRLARNEVLPPHHRDHRLIGDYKSCRECHISSDWLLIYKVNDDELILIRTGSHSQLFS
tara:strand:- start:467 stop:736 length:270 start_codon:yes stop_codon:yes gene_type:complete